MHPALPTWTLPALLLVMALAGPVVVRAAEAADDNGPYWSELSAPERKALAPLQADWTRLTPVQRQKWREIGSRLPNLPPDEVQRVRERMNEWAALSPDQRGRVRLQFQEASRWSASDRQERWEAYQSLHPDARKVLAERWKFEAVPARSLPPGGDVSGKRNLIDTVTAPKLVPRSVTPVEIQAQSGATTRKLTAPRNEPAYFQPGVPKIAATDAFVDPKTLLPRRGPQGAAMARSNPPATQE
jgi:hypothetical protein